MRVALYQPDIPQNTGTILRLCACLGVDVDIIAPAGFDMSDKSLRRAGLDYLDAVSITRHENFETFQQQMQTERRRLLLLTTKASVPYYDFQYAPSDVLLLGRESAGVPQSVRARVNCGIIIPMRKDLRSLNVAVSTAIVLGEAFRQTGGFKTFV